jgi:hypothetical protein
MIEPHWPVNFAIYHLLPLSAQGAINFDPFYFFQVHL